MKTTTLQRTLAIGVIATALPLQAQLVFNAAADFSTNQNPNGVWSYGWMSPTYPVFTLFERCQPLWDYGIDDVFIWMDPAYDGTATISINTSDEEIIFGLGNNVHLLPHTLNWHPGRDNQLSVVRWTAPTAGTLHLSAACEGRDAHGTTTDVQIHHNSQLLFQGNINGFGSRVSFSKAFVVPPGDTVDFRLGYGNGSHVCDTTQLDATIALTNWGGWIGIHQTSYSVAENARAIAMEVKRTGPEHLDELVTVDYSTVDASAKAGEDYAAVSGTLTFQAGQTEQEIRVPIINDNDWEFFEKTFMVRLSNPTGGTSLGYPAEAAVNILDDERITHYVSLVSTNPRAPFATWETAATNIQDAVDLAKDGETVLVMDGMYAVGGKTNEWGYVENRVTITNAIRLKSVNGPLVTTVGGRGGRCVYLGTNAVLSGFTVTGGGNWWSPLAGGVYCEMGAVVTNCVITGNHSGGSGAGVCGGTLYDCTISSNRTSGNNVNPPGGGAYRATLYGCKLVGNRAESSRMGEDGSGAYECALFNCHLEDNEATRCTLRDCLLTACGGALSCILYNCTLAGNHGPSDGTFFNCILTGNAVSSGGTFYNCTVTGNDGGGIGRDWRFSGSSTVFNSIICYNSGGNYAEGTTLNYCLTSPVPTNGVGNITGPPLFMDMAAGDFRLREDSPCLDAGTNLLGLAWAYWTGTWDPNTGEDIWYRGSITEPTDILGNTRFIDGNGDGIVAWDIGAYEFNSFKPPRFVVAPQRTSEGWTLNITGPLHKWVSLERSGDLRNWEPIWSGFMWEETRQVATDNLGGAMFYRMRVP